jgi:hypothetical protein
MIQRLCPQCGSELVRARRTDEKPELGAMQGASPGWRCTVCGGGFTTKQIRKSNRDKSQLSDRRENSAQRTKARIFSLALVSVLGFNVASKLSRQQFPVRGTSTSIYCDLVALPSMTVAHVPGLASVSYLKV